MAQELTPKEKLEAKEADSTRPGRSYLPDVDIREDEDALFILADVPGVKQERISVDLEDGVLTIRGDVSLEDYEGLSPVYTEYSVGNFIRRFNLPSGRFEIDGIEARVASGVLEVRIPKAKQARQRKIPIQAA